MTTLEGATSEAPARPRIAKLTLTIWKGLGRRQKFSLVIALLLMGITAGAESMVPILIGNTINDVSDGDFTFDSVLWSLGLVLAVMLTGKGFAVLRQQVVETTATAYERDARVNILKHAMHVTLSYYRARSSGQVNERISRGIEGSAKLLKLMFMDLLPAVILAVVAIAASFQAGVIVGIATAGVVPIGLLLVRLQIRSQDGIRTQIRDAKEKIVGVIVAVLPNIAVIRSYGSEAFVHADIVKEAHNVRSAEMKHHRAMGGFDLLKTSNESIFTLIVILASITAFALGAIPVGSIMTNYLLFQKILAPLGEIHRMLDESAEAAKQTHDLFEFANEPLDARYSKD